MHDRFWCVSSHSNLAYQSPYRGESRATAISRWSSCRYLSGNIPRKCEIQKIRVYNTLAFSAKRDVNTRRQLLDKSRKSELVCRTHQTKAESVNHARDKINVKKSHGYLVKEKNFAEESLTEIRWDVSKTVCEMPNKALKLMRNLRYIFITKMNKD